MTKAGASKKPENTALVMKTSEPIPSWVNDMHQHFRVNGYYRAVDLQRVLGDPTASVKGTATAGPANNNGTNKR